MKKHGPFSIDELKDQKIEMDTLIWHEGLSDWTAAKDVNMFSDFFKVPPPVPSDPILIPKSPKTPPIRKYILYIALVLTTSLSIFLFFRSNNDNKIRESYRSLVFKQSKQISFLEKEKSLILISNYIDDYSILHNYMQKWVSDESLTNEPFKIEARKLLDITINKNLLEIAELSKNWGDIDWVSHDLVKISDISVGLISQYNAGVRDVLTDLESYADERLFFAQSTFELEILPVYSELALTCDNFLEKLRGEIIK